MRSCALSKSPAANSSTRMAAVRVCACVSCHEETTKVSGQTTAAPDQTVRSQSLFSSKPAKPIDSWPASSSSMSTAVAPDYAYANARGRSRLSDRRRAKQSSASRISFVWQNACRRSWPPRPTRAGKKGLKRGWSRDVHPTGLAPELDKIAICWLYFINEHP